MPRVIFEKILDACRQRHFFQQRTDASGLLGCSTEQKFLSALRQITLGTSAFAQAEYSGVSETTALISIDELCIAVLDNFEEEYLRYPTKAEQRRIENTFMNLGFPGCLGAVDCSSWEWKNCPTAWHGEYKGREKKPVVRMEVWADYSLRIWSFYFGCSGTHNDTNILQSSPLFNRILNGSYDLSVNDIKLPGFIPENYYFLADGIYPKWSIFALSISRENQASVADIMYSSRQESVRKCIERVFGVMFARFHVLAHPARTWKRSKLLKLSKACAVIHNMIVEERSCEQEFVDSLEESVAAKDGTIVLENFGRLQRLESRAVTVEEQGENLIWAASNTIRSKTQFSLLQDALKRHISSL